MGGRPPSMTKLGAKRVRTIRARGGNQKVRALRLDSGNYSWGSENCTRKVLIMDVVNNAIVQIDATLFKQWYLQRYGTDLSKKKKSERGSAIEEMGCSRHAKALKIGRAKIQRIDPLIEEQFANGRLLAAISSRPG